MNNRYQVYPNRCGKLPTDENRGALRVGYVEDNTDMQERCIADHLAAVTHEENGQVRFYIFTSTPADSLFPNVPMWTGPYQAYSEEIIPMEAGRRTCPDCGADIIDDGSSCFYCETKPEGIL